MPTKTEQEMFEQMAKDYYQDRIRQWAAGPPCETEQFYRWSLENDDTLDSDEREGDARNLLDILEGECLLRGGRCIASC